jgi:ribosome biogenesis GTPase
MLAFEDGAERLAAIGLTADLAARARALAPIHPDATALGRVVAVHRAAVRWHDGRAERTARLATPLARALDAEGEPLAVGDWVLLDGDGRVRARVPPASRLARLDGDGRRHAVVANVDTVLVAMGLDDDWNPRRAERYLALAHGSGVGAVLVLTKADVAARDPATRDARLAALALRLGPDVPCLAVDATDPATAPRVAAALGERLAPGRTLVLLGSSGAGKSTLTNTLLGRAAQDTGPVRAHDSRGMHTTTARTLHPIPGGACIVDTPGVRTLRPDADAATVAASFVDIAALAGRCRFRDCRHADEPGCAVRAAVDPDRLRNFGKLVRESEREGRTWLDRRRELGVWKARGQQARAAARSKRGA